MENLTQNTRQYWGLQTNLLTLYNSSLVSIKILDRKQAVSQFIPNNTESNNNVDQRCCREVLPCFFFGFSRCQNFLKGGAQQKNGAIRV